MNKKGKIEISRKGFFTVESGGERIVCKACTRLRIENKEPLCGDIVLFEDNGDKTGFITDILPRRNVLLRPSIANVDVMVLTVAAAYPEPDLFYVDKMTCVGVKAGIPTVIVINKNDIENGERYAEIYNKCGFRTFLTSGNTGEGTDELKSFLRGKTAVFAGPSGVGKSSLLNIMYPECKSEIGELSAGINRGKNTTRHTELYPTENGGYIADTPGFTSLDFEKYDILEIEDLENVFPETAKYLGKCRYRNCTHIKDEGCCVAEAVENGIIPSSRHESYIKLYGILKNKKKY